MTTYWLAIHAPILELGLAIACLICMLAAHWHSERRITRLEQRMKLLIASKSE